MVAASAGASQRTQAAWHARAAALTGLSDAFAFVNAFVQRPRTTRRATPCWRTVLTHRAPRRSSGPRRPMARCCWPAACERPGGGGTAHRRPRPSPAPAASSCPPAARTPRRGPARAASPWRAGTPAPRPARCAASRALRRPAPRHPRRGASSCPAPRAASSLRRRLPRDVRRGPGRRRRRCARGVTAPAARRRACGERGGGGGAQRGPAAGDAWTAACVGTNSSSVTTANCMAQTLCNAPSHPRAGLKPLPAGPPCARCFQRDVDAGMQPGAERARTRPFSF